MGNCMQPRKPLPNETDALLMLKNDPKEEEKIEKEKQELYESLQKEAQGLQEQIKACQIQADKYKQKAYASVLLINTDERDMRLSDLDLVPQSYPMKLGDEGKNKVETKKIRKNAKLFGAVINGMLTEEQERKHDGLIEREAQLQERKKQLEAIKIELLQKETFLAELENKNIETEKKLRVLNEDRLCLVRQVQGMKNTNTSLVKKKESVLVMNENLKQEVNAMSLIPPPPPVKEFQQRFLLPNSEFPLMERNARIGHNQGMIYVTARYVIFSSSDGVPAVVRVLQKKISQLLHHDEPLGSAFFSSSYPSSSTHASASFTTVFGSLPSFNPKEAFASLSLPFSSDRTSGSLSSTSIGLSVGSLVSSPFSGGALSRDNETLMGEEDAKFEITGIQSIRKLSNSFSAMPEVIFTTKTNEFQIAIEHRQDFLIEILKQAAWMNHGIATYRDQREEDFMRNESPSSSSSSLGL